MEQKSFEQAKPGEIYYYRAMGIFRVGQRSNKDNTYTWLADCNSAGTAELLIKAMVPRRKRTPKFGVKTRRSK